MRLLFLLPLLALSGCSSINSEIVKATQTIQALPGNAFTDVGATTMVPFWQSSFKVASASKDEVSGTVQLQGFDVQVQVTSIAGIPLGTKTVHVGTASVRVPPASAPASAPVVLYGVK